MDLDGWHPDPFGTHEERLFEQGRPTSLVRDGGVGSYDELPPERPPDPQPAPPAPSSETQVPASAAGPPVSRPSLANRSFTRRWWLWVPALVVVGIIIAVAVGGKSVNPGGAQLTAFCVNAPHDTACPDSLLQSQKALLHNFWEAYLTGSACYPQRCPANKAELLLAAAATARKWLPEVEGGRATTPAAKTLKNEITYVLAAANADKAPSGAVATTTVPTIPPATS